MRVQDDFKYYSSSYGVYKPANCGIISADLYSLNHVVLAIGFGTMGSDDYILIRNSWGSGWGYGGYAYIYADPTPGSSGTCGIYLINYIVNARKV